MISFLYSLFTFLFFPFLLLISHFTLCLSPCSVLFHVLPFFVFYCDSLVFFPFFLTPPFAFLFILIFSFVLFPRNTVLCYCEITRIIFTGFFVSPFFLLFLSLFPKWFRYWSQEKPFEPGNSKYNTIFSFHFLFSPLHMIIFH